MLSLNTRRQQLALLAVVVMTIACPLAALAALTPAQLDDDGKPIPKRAPVHHVALDEKQRDIEALKAEVQKLRAEAEMCRAGAGKK